MTKSSGSPIEFRYDAAGNRVEKKQGTAITRYIRDASGNVMAVYQNNVLTERPIYGSSRLGQLDSASAPGYRRVGLKRYELSNHLGNVLAVVSDRIRMKTDSTWVEVISRSDYYPFGLEMTGRTESATYRYGFNGKEKDNPGMGGGGSTYDYGFRIYNPTIGKFLSVDPLTKSYPMLTPYQFASNRTIDGVDLDGLEYYYAADGKFLGRIGESKKVFVAKEILIQRREYLDPLGNKIIERFRQPIDEYDLNVDIDVFMGLASAIHRESSGNRKESMAIGNAHMNFLVNGGSKLLKTLEDIVMYDNTLVQGANLEGYDQFVKSDENFQNSKGAISSAVNALGFYSGIENNGFMDYSLGADAWDGLDLIFTNYENDHRTWIWSSDSKDILSQYRTMNKGGVDTDGFKYSNENYDVKATTIIGKTLFQKYNTPRGGRKQSSVRFKMD